MDDRVIDLNSEQDLFSTNALPRDFWERYFAIQKAATMVELQNGSFTVQLTDEKTGKTQSYENVRFSTESGSQPN